MWIGRIGRESAPPDRSSPGADVSERMITFGSERLREIGHSRFRQGSAFADFFDTSFDMVHFTNMHPQFDELDRGRYGKDSCPSPRPDLNRHDRCCVSSGLVDVYQ